MKIYILNNWHDNIEAFKSVDAAFNYEDMRCPDKIRLGKKETGPSFGESAVTWKIYVPGWSSPQAIIMEVPVHTTNSERIMKIKLRDTKLMAGEVAQIENALVDLFDRAIHDGEDWITKRIELIADLLGVDVKELLLELNTHRYVSHIRSFDREQS